MKNLEEVFKLVKKNEIQFYLEHNDFLATDLSIGEELDEITSKKLLTHEEEKLCFAFNSIWSARFYYGDDEMVIAYSYDAEECAAKILESLRNIYE